MFGIRNNAIQTRLLIEDKLTMEKALEIAQSMEMADHDMKTTKNSTPMTPTALYLPAKSNLARIPCFRSGNLK